MTTILALGAFLIFHLLKKSFQMNSKHMKMPLFSICSMFQKSRMAQLQKNAMMASQIIKGVAS